MKKILKKVGSIIKKPFTLIGKGLGSIARKLPALKKLATPFLFIREATRELSQVTWLTRKDTVKFSLQILLLMVVAAVSIAALDLIFFKGLKFLLS